MSTPWSHASVTLHGDRISRPKLVIRMGDHLGGLEDPRDKVNHKGPHRMVAQRSEEEEAMCHWSRSWSLLLWL